MVLITWLLEAGVRDGRCVGCVFDFLDGIEANAAVWRRDFGQVPAFRAALHGGFVVTAEVGVDRHKIAYFGDVVNTTGRMEALCRTLGAPLLISSNLLGRITALPEGVRAFPLGAHALKGRGEMLDVSSLESTLERSRYRIDGVALRHRDRTAAADASLFQPRCGDLGNIQSG